MNELNGLNLTDMVSQVSLGNYSTNLIETRGAMKQEQSSTFMEGNYLKQEN
jgi:uncharacterized protein YejL (UPF0352 family)